MLDILRGNLKKDKVQRLIYGLGLVLLICFRSEFVLDSFKSDDYAIAAWHVFLPSAILLLQAVFNRWFLWVVMLCYISIYSLWVIGNIIDLDVLIDMHRDYSPQPFWTLERVGNWLIILVSLFILNWTAWKIKPSPR